MRKNTLTAILGALAIISVVPAARAEIASRAYVDNQVATKMDAMTIDSEPTANSTNLVTSGAVATAIANAVASGLQYEAQDLGIAFFGSVNAETGEPDNTLYSTGRHGIDSELMAPGAISMNSIKLPTPPAECAAAGGSCVLVAKGVNGYTNSIKYVWENIGRDSNETLPTSGEISGTSYNDTGNAIMWEPGE